MTGRRGHGEGSIHRRQDGRWAAYVSLGWKDNRRHRKWFYGKTRAEVGKKLNDALKAHHGGLPLIDDRRTTEGFITEWLAAVRPTLRPRTWQRYEELLRLHALPEVGKLRLAHLEPRHLHQLYASKLEKGLSPTTVGHIHRVLHRALDQATRWGLTPRNVAALVSPPRVAYRDMTTLDTEQVGRLFRSASGDRLEALYVLAVTTGMREGELLALHW